MTTRNPEDRLTRWITGLLAVLILIPSMYGFVGKFVEFVHVFRGDPSGIFAITPIVNYLCASLGFFCLLIWATRNGMFHEVEQPKYDMLDRERELDGRSAMSEAKVWRR